MSKLTELQPLNLNAVLSRNAVGFAVRCERCDHAALSCKPETTLGSSPKPLFRTPAKTARKRLGTPEVVSFPDSAAQNRTQRILARHGASYSSGFGPVIIDLRGLRICCFAVSSMYSLTFCGTTLVYICSTCLSSSAASVVFFCSRYISIADSFSSGICTVIDLFMSYLPCSFPQTHLLSRTRPRLTSLLLPLSQAQQSA